MYGLSNEDLELQAQARGFVDGLIPYEAEAELNGGELPEEVDKEFRARAKELGLMATNMPAGTRRGRALDASAGAGPRAGRSGDQRGCLDALHATFVVRTRGDRVPDRKMAEAGRAR